jgi:type II secretory ATPase GspE/PulE/Tfp pilus assembly ATPase PilB-like protein
MYGGISPDYLNDKYMYKKTDIFLTELLLEKGLIERKDLEPLVKEADTLTSSLQEVLVRHGLFRERELLELLSEKLKLSLVDLNSLKIEKAVLDKVPVKIATYYRFIPIRIKERVLTVAVSGPLEIRAQDEIRTQLGFDIEMVLASLSDIVEGLKKYYGLAADTLDKIISQVSKTDAQPSGMLEKVEDIEKLAGDASVIKLVNQIIIEAHRKRATDIHIEPYRGEVSLRYRVDGLLYDANIPPEIKSLLSAIISRIKIMANLNIVERRLPQDGRAVVKIQENVIDLRISTIPTPYGESVVIRILPTQMLLGLERLGLGKRDVQVFEQLIQKPHGIIFVTGPTGSGKTTTLYACLNRINTKERKIITIEDPIEYEMNGITQIQVMPEIGLDFARGLRSMLRHDPDVMMVGEVRDLETAEIAIRVALTGHLVFSTIHTNDAASGITRLVDIGVEPYLVASSVEAFIAQRLIRLICQDCKYEDSSAPEELKGQVARDLGLRSSMEVKIFRGKGCPSCNFTGFFGRTAIYEILLIDEAIKDLIVKKSPASQIKKLAVSAGMRTLRQDGWQKVISGLTTPEEVMKVTSVEDYVESEKGKESAQSVYNDNYSGSPSGFGKRAWGRLSSKINLRFKAFKSQEELLKRGFKPEQLSVTRDISAGGLLFISNESLEIGSILELKIELPNDEEPIECLARVVRIDETDQANAYNVAICFLDIAGAERSRLNKYIQAEGE